MNHLAIQFPQPETVNIQTSYYDYINLQITPYPYCDLDQIARAIIEYKITLPFEKIVTRSDGISVCSQCGAKIAGNQPKCPAIVEWYNRGYGCDNRMKPGIFVGMVIDGYNNKITNAEWKPCNGDLEWDLQEEFYKQERFFNFVQEFIKYGTEYTKSEFELLVGNPNSVQAMRICQLEQRLQEQELAMGRVFSALQQIADKMNQAGSALSF